MSPVSNVPGFLAVLALRALATWRVTHMFMYEAGPWNIFLRLRAHFGVLHDDGGTPIAYPDGSLFECFLCFSVWAGFCCLVVPQQLASALSLSALAIWAEKRYSGVGRRG